MGSNWDGPAFMHSKFSFIPKPSSTPLALDYIRLLINRLLSNCDAFVMSPVTLSPKIMLIHCANFT